MYVKMRNTLRWVCGNCLGREKDEREREGAEENEGGEKGESFLWRRMWGSDDLSLEFIAILAQMSDLNEGGEKKREGTRMNIQHVFNFSMPRHHHFLTRPNRHPSKYSF